MNPTQIASEAIDYAIGLAIKLLGEGTARQTLIDRIEIVAARVAADAEAAARFGQVPPADG